MGLGLHLNIGHMEDRIRQTHQARVSTQDVWSQAESGDWIQSGRDEVKGHSGA